MPRSRAGSGAVPVCFSQFGRLGYGQGGFLRGRGLLAGGVACLLLVPLPPLVGSCSACSFRRPTQRAAALENLEDTKLEDRRYVCIVVVRFCCCDVGACCCCCCLLLLLVVVPCCLLLLLLRCCRCHTPGKHVPARQGRTSRRIVRRHAPSLKKNVSNFRRAAGWCTSSGM